MRTLCFLTLLLLSLNARAQETALDALTKATLVWSHNCDESGKICRLEKIISFNTQSGMERGALIVSYNIASKQPEFVSIILPKDVPPKSEVLIRFIDSVQKNGKWELVPASEDFTALPISGCGPAGCQARVHTQIPDGPNLFEEIQKRNFMWVAFTRNGKPERFLVPLDGFGEEFRSIK